MSEHKTQLDIKIKTSRILMEIHVQNVKGFKVKQLSKIFGIYL